MGWPLPVSQIFYPLINQPGLRSAVKALLAVQESRIRTDSDRAFAFRAPRLWKTFFF